MSGNPIAKIDPLGLWELADIFPTGAPIVNLGRAYGALAAYNAGSLTGNQALADAAMEGLQCTRLENLEAVGLLLSMGRGKNTTSRYQKVGPNGDHLKFGVANNPATRYTTQELGGGRLKILAEGPRSEMLKLERNLHENLPIGPQEGPKIYTQKQIEKGQLAPPH